MRQDAQKVLLVENFFILVKCDIEEVKDDQEFTVACMMPLYIDI